MIIIDKVFSSSGSSTLEVLVIGLFIIAIFDFVISYSRKHLLSHMTAIIDVTMVSKFFRHLTSLPLRGPFRILCQLGKIKNTKGHEYENRDRCRAIC